MADLTAREVEDAGTYEVLQSPGASLGSWAILGGLLDPANQHFVFLQPLGQSREVKTALSGLFGRFVARAYLTRYWNYSNFAHVTKPPMLLSGVVGAQVIRLHNGDMPDWIIWDPLQQQLAIAEAKGCHDRAGPDKALARAWTQANRADVMIGGLPAPLKRFAIATRWGVATAPTMNPIISVKDPEEDGRQISKNERDALGVGIARRHMGSLFRGLGYAELSRALLRAAEAPRSQLSDGAALEARRLTEMLPRREVKTPTIAPAIEDTLAGGYVTQAGPLRVDEEVSPSDAEMLKRVGLRPTFIGIEWETLLAVIDGDATRITELRSKRPRRGTSKSSETEDDQPTEDGAGTWSVRLDRDKASIS